MKLSVAFIALVAFDLASAELATVTASNTIADRRRNAVPTVLPRFAGYHRLSPRQEAEENKPKPSSTNKPTTNKPDPTTSKPGPTSKPSTTKDPTPKPPTDKPTPTPSPNPPNPPDPNPPNPPNPPESQPLTAGTIAGIAVGSAAGVVIIVGAIGFLFWRARRSRSDKHAAMWNAAHEKDPGPALPPPTPGAPPGGPINFNGNLYSPVPGSSVSPNTQTTSPGPGAGLGAAALTPGKSVDGGSVKSHDPLWVPGDGARPPPVGAVSGGVVQSHSVELPVDGAEVAGRKATPPRVELAG